MLDYLAERSIDIEMWNPHRLGVVDSPVMPEHEGYVGWISIPYLRPGALPVGMKFRRPPGDENGAKYKAHSGMGQRLYIPTHHEHSDVVFFTEGEFDAIVLADMGFHSYAIPGANAWKDEWKYIVEGYSRVLIVGDGDDPGRKFADQINACIPYSRVVPMPDRHDISSLVTEEGPDAFRARAAV